MSAVLVDGNENPIQNGEASVESQFIVDVDSSIILPLLYVSSPTPSQVLASSPISVTFGVENHPILPSGSHLRYSVDGGAQEEHRTYDPIQIGSLEPGEHSLSLVLVDENGLPVSSEYANVEMKFFIGANSDVDLRFYMDEDAIRGENLNEATGCDSHYVDVDVANIYMANIRSPLDVQFIAAETSKVNPAGGQSILIAKLRSPSWMGSLGTTTSNTDNTTIFGSLYLDGHSVVQIDLYGNLLFSNNAAKFADDLETAKMTLGSAEKISDNELLIADAARNRAIITLTNLDSKKPFVAWQYDSDRAVSDFHLMENKQIEISISDGSISDDDIGIKSGTTIVFSNDSLVPIQILSGTTTQEQFLEDPDLTLYGDEFSSGTLNPGEKYSFRFDDIGIFDWFYYDGTDIGTGSINVSQGRVSSRDEYLIVENDPSTSMFGSRVIKVNAWGDVLWSFGEDWLHHPKDARGSPDGSVLIST